MWRLRWPPQINSRGLFRGCDVIRCKGRTLLLSGKTLGIIGQGNIAKEVIARAKGMDMKVVMWSRFHSPPPPRALQAREGCAEGCASCVAHAYPEQLSRGIRPRYVDACDRKGGRATPGCSRLLPTSPVAVAAAV